MKYDNTKRIGYIDTLKFLGMFAIYLGHFGAFAGRAYGFVFTYHVPLFFFASGCIESVSKEYKFTDYLLKKIKGILVPYFLFSVCSVILKLVSSKFVFREMLSYLKVIMLGCVRNSFFAGAFWFLTCLFVIEIAFYFIKKLKKKWAIFIVCFSLFLISELILPKRPIIEPSCFWNIDSAIYYIIYFAVGYISFPLINKLLSDKKYMPAVITAGVASAVYSVLVFFGYDILSVINGCYFFSILAVLIRAMVIIVFNLSVAYVIKNIPFLCKLGMESLQMCCSEYMVKTIVYLILNSIGIALNFKSPVHTMIYTFVLMIIVHFCFAPVERIIVKCVNKIIDAVLFAVNIDKDKKQLKC